MPWAAGSRNCLGMPQAQVTMQATLATLLSRFSFRLAERVRPSTRGLAFSFQTWTPAYLLMRCLLYLDEMLCALSVSGVHRFDASCPNLAERLPACLSWRCHLHLPGRQCAKFVIASNVLAVID